MLNTHEKMAVIFKQRLRANFEMDSQVFGDHHGSKTNDSYSLIFSLLLDGSLLRSPFLASLVFVSEIFRKVKKINRKSLFF